MLKPSATGSINSNPLCIKRTFLPGLKQTPLMIFPRQRASRAICIYPQNSTHFIALHSSHPRASTWGSFLCAEENPVGFLLVKARCFCCLCVGLWLKRRIFSDNKRELLLRKPNICVTGFSDSEEAEVQFEEVTKN